MIGFGSAHPLEGIEKAPDTVVNFALAAATAQAADWPTGTQMVRLSGLSSANTPLHFYANTHSTAATLPVGGTTATTASTLRQLAVIGSRYLQISTGISTGFSIYAQTSGYFVAECWNTK